jgi:hypothetical protein
MTGILSQLITLVSFGNDYLRHDRLDADFYPGHPSFNYCREVFFSRQGPDNSRDAAGGEVIAKDPGEWLAVLKKKGCDRLRLYFNYSGNEDFPDYKSAGMVGGGGTWWIEAEHPGGADIWAVRWTVTDKDNPQHRIWTAEYGLLSENGEPTLMPCDLEVIKGVVRERMEAIAAFAEEHKLSRWHLIFRQALDILDSKEPGRLTDEGRLIPTDNYSLIATQLLFAAGKAWVFGAMGSWNDLSFSDEAVRQPYEKLSYDLYDCICVSILAAVNSY